MLNADLADLAHINCVQSEAVDFAFLKQVSRAIQSELGAVSLVAKQCDEHLGVRASTTYVARVHLNLVVYTCASNRWDMENAVALPILEVIPTCFRK